MPPKSTARRGGFKTFGKKRSSPGDDDTVSRATKKTKPADDEDAEEEGAPYEPKLLKDDNGDDYVGLKANGMRRVTISDFKGNTLVSIREYWTNDEGKVLPGKKGIALTLNQYNAFLTALPLIEEALQKKGDKVTRPVYDAEDRPLPNVDWQEEVTNDNDVKAADEESEG